MRLIALIGLLSFLFLASPVEAAFTVTGPTETAIDWAGAGAVTCNLPASVAAGDLLLVAINGDGAINGPDAYAWPGSWVDLVDTDQGTVVMGIGYLIASGGETTVAVTINSGTADQLVCHAYRIQGWHGTTVPEANSQTAAAIETPDGGASLNPANWDVESTLWFVFLGLNGAATIDAYPANYTANGVYEPCNPQTSCGIASSYREVSAASEDPGTWDLSSATNATVAAVVAVRPSAQSQAPRSMHQYRLRR